MSHSTVLLGEKISLLIHAEAQMIGVKHHRPQLMTAVFLVERISLSIHGEASKSVTSSDATLMPEVLPELDKVVSDTASFLPLIPSSSKSSYEQMVLVKPVSSSKSIGPDTLVASRCPYIHCNNE